MEPTNFKTFMETHGKKSQYSAGQVFHTQDFAGRLFLLKAGYVKRYQARNLEQKVLELIYGPGHIISLSQLYKILFGVDQNQNDFLYVYQAMTDVELLSIDADSVIAELKMQPEMYKDFFFESGIKLRSNITRLASNSIKDENKKVAHQIASLAYEFAGLTKHDVRNSIVLPLPQTAVDLAEQLNISQKSAETALKRLVDKKIIGVEGSIITILDMEFLRDVYL